MNSHYYYLLILACSFFGPLILSFDKKIAFYKKWKFVFPATIITALIFIVWDIYFTKMGVWSFNPKYVEGVYFKGLPLSEILFFIIIPYCCLFIYECLKGYFPKFESRKSAEYVFLFLGLILLIFGLVNISLKYTSYAFLFCGLLLLTAFLFRKHLKNFSFNLFLFSYLISILPFMIVNGILTYLPIVSYNDNENLGFRIGTIPFEDIFYGMAMMILTTVLFELFQSKKVSI